MCFLKQAVHLDTLLRHLLLEIRPRSRAPQVSFIHEVHIHRGGILPRLSLIHRLRNSPACVSGAPHPIWVAPLVKAIDGDLHALPRIHPVHPICLRHPSHLLFLRISWREDKAAMARDL